MELSANAQRALDQVKMGLYMLYGADYFTEEEWIKIDGLIHKGKYVFTSGPPSNILEEPLMTFEESKEETESQGQVQPVEPLKETKVNNVVVTEEQVSSPSSEQADSIESRTRSPNETSAETSDEDSGLPPPPSTKEETPMFDFSEAATPAAGILTADTSAADISAADTPAKVEPRPEPRPRTENGLPPGTTQEQLDEIRAFNATLTKAGKKSRPKYKPEPVEEEEEYPPAWGEDFAEPPPAWPQDFAEPPVDEQSYPSPAPNEREARISSWAKEVSVGPQSPPLQAPTPSRAPPAAPIVEVLAEQFIKAHGRPPKALNDFYQPKNPEHNPKRPDSRASLRTSKTSKSVAKSVVEQASSTSNGNPPPSKLSIEPGKIYTAQSSVSKKGIRFEVRSGDHIKVIKYVSGIMYIGVNLRSKEHGQFPETIFKRTAGATKGDSLIEQQRSLAKARAVAQMTAAPTKHGLDEVENVNAAEWDEESIIRPRTTAPVAPSNSSRAALGGGLAASRFSVLADSDTQSLNSDAQQREFTPEMAREFGKIINDKVDEILKARGVAPTPIPTGPRARSRAPVKEPLKPVPPKTETCWFWSVKNDCRFTAEECRDLHAHVPSKPGEPSNLHMGKPTWGALADSVPSQTPSRSSLLSQVNSKGKTCYYWAIDGKCTYSAENCKYLHEHNPSGIAPKPPGRSWRRGAWRRASASISASKHADANELESQLDDSDADVDGELVLEEVQEQDTVLDAWGLPVAQSTWAGSAWGDDKYKPPHIKALEDKMLKEAVGW